MANTRADANKHHKRMMQKLTLARGNIARLNNELADVTARLARKTAEHTDLKNRVDAAQKHLSAQ